ncbi:MAG TPA: hypothetical protein VFE47_31430 [Tepidisphaeraceae bacterium]|jgi:hypothetical protein|nr:hypothetical protein [Tepidisphaeraceae bacterium]
MRIISFASPLFLLLAVFALSGCARMTAETALPLYDPTADLTFDNRMLGVWLPDTVCVKLCRGEGKAYTAAGGGMSWLVIFGDTLNKAERPQEIHLVKIGKYTYFFAAPLAGESGTSLTGCCKVEYVKDRIVLHGLNLQAVADDLVKHPDALKHEWIERAQRVSTTQASDAPNAVSATQPATQPDTRPAVPTTQPSITINVAINVRPTARGGLAAADAATQPATSPTTLGSLYDGDLKITDTPAAVRAYLVAHQDDGEFFSDAIVLYRVAK